MCIYIIRPLREAGNCEHITVMSEERAIDMAKDEYPGVSTLFTILFNFLS